MKKIRRCLVIVAAGITMLQGCSISDGGRYSIKQDSAPHFDYGDIEYVEPTPEYLPHNVWTSRPYEVLGGYYTPMLDAKGFEDIGYSSWYGQKFHGHTTANGEIFDMFSLTAAHRTLPLPSFLRVTNLENNKTTTVRVNDRGPFHDDRILDLSYAAAKKLGFHNNGVAKVKIEIIHVAPNGAVTVGSQQSDTRLARNSVELNPATPIRRELSSSIADSDTAKGPSTTDIRVSQQLSGQSSTDSLSDSVLFVQVAATSDAQKAKELATGLSNLLQVPNSIPKVNNVYRLHLGPLENEQRAEKLIQDLKNIGFDSAFRVEFSPQ
ncbi:septal ring lytic transglycosylase RlpA family protein [Glaciecola sp. XM2]|uniref:septal ring lytic transglycosylase RlpA family protein n=1 Tax=Glaciecola sp. XM2 TaxID=1914931 RepID=UPI001BDDE4F3|nr:septal ring lytic transglycosylase RlpA family protein [Glaciecola sp. XM2]MBT1452039.1 septal ring lytic transglycosylase RlpA family protein [Glaciecola sp. XM2]